MKSKLTDLDFEAMYPLLFGMIAGCLWTVGALWGRVMFPDSDTILSSTLTVSGIFVGFLATNKSILIGMNSPIIARLRSSGYINEIVSYLGEAIWFNLAFCAFNVVGFFVCRAPWWY